MANEANTLQLPGMTTHQRDIRAYKVLKIYFNNWHEILKGHFDLNGISASLEGWSDIRSRMDAEAWKLLYDNETDAVIVPKYYSSAYIYDLYAWNHWNKDSEGVNPYKDGRTSMLPDGLLTTFNRLYEAIAPKLADDEKRKVFRQDLFTILMETRFEASQFAGFHCHRSMGICIQENFDNATDITQSKTIYDHIICKVKLRGMIFEAQNGWIGEEMQFLSLYSPLPPEARAGLARSLRYIDVGDLYTYFDYIAWREQRDTEETDPAKAAELFGESSPPPEKAEDGIGDEARQLLRKLVSDWSVGWQS